jgi:hypothetical protein
MASTGSPPPPSPASLKAIARDFLVLLHIGIWNPSTIHLTSISFFHHLLPLVPPHAILVYSPVFVVNIYVGVQRSFSAYLCCGCALLWSVQPLPFLSLTLYPPPPSPFFNSFQYTSSYPLPSQMSCFMILLMLCHSLFLSLFPRVPWSSSIVTNMFYTWVCIWSCLFLCICLSLDLPCMRENMCLLCFWAWLTSLNIMSSTCIHLPSNHVPLLLMAE